MYLFWLLIMGFAFVFNILMIAAPKRKLIFALFALVLWFGLAAATASLQFPYVFYSDTENVAYSGNFSVETGAPGITSLSFGLGMFTFAWIFLLVVDGYLVKRGRRSMFE